MKVAKYAVVVVAVLALAALACGSSNEGQKVDEKPAAPAATATKPTLTTYAVGDVIEVKDHTICLDSVEFQGDVLHALFSVENNGSEDLTVSSLMSFSATLPDGTKLEQEIFDCSPGLDGSVLPGDKLKGNICWKGAADTVRLYYEASLFGSGAVVWEVTK